jgi:carbohydrate-selective porin OprB
MKKILKPAEKEESAYYSDFTGKPLGQFDPTVELKMIFNFGSKYDNSQFNIHLSDEDAEKIIEFISGNLSDDSRKQIQKNLEQLDVYYEDAMDSRAWDECDLLHNNREVYKKLLGLKDR